MSHLHDRIRDLLVSQNDASYRISAGIQARQKLFGVRPSGFGTGSGFEKKKPGSINAVERHQGPTDAVRNAKSKREEGA